VGIANGPHPRAQRLGERMHLGRYMQLNLQRVWFPSEFNGRRVEGMRWVVRMQGTPPS
jgi:hypothetical protein